MAKVARSYQVKCVNECLGALRDYRRALLVAPCGAGKSFIASLIIKALLHSGRKVLFLVHLKTLIDQMHDEFDKNNIPHGVIKSGFPEDRSKLIQLASVQTLSRRDWWKHQGCDLIICDEAHETCFNRVFKEFLADNPNTRILGLTATPYRLKRTESLADIFHDERMLVQAPTRLELKEMGFLVPETQYYSLDAADISQVSTSMGDFKTNELAIVCNREDLILKILDDYRDKADGLPFIGFCVDVDHAKNATRIFKSKGVNCELVTGETPNSERLRLFDAFDRGTITGLFSVGVLSIGFDSPKAVVGLMLRPTQSKALWLQQVGRVERACQGKNIAIILDQAGNTLRHGKSEWESEFTLDKLSEKPRSGEAPTKVCPECKAIHHISVKMCDNCWHVFENKNKKKLHQKSALVKIGDRPTKRINNPHYVKDLPLFSGENVVVEEGVRESTKAWYQSTLKAALDSGTDNYKRDMIRKIKGHRPVFNMKEFLWFAEQLEYKPGWAWYTWNELVTKKSA